jgi:hypothetical protein
MKSVDALSMPTAAVLIARDQADPDARPRPLPLPPEPWDSGAGLRWGTSQKARHPRITGYGVSAGRPAGKGLSRSRNVASRRRRLRGGEVDPVGPPAKSARVTRTLAQATAYGPATGAGVPRPKAEAV